jgi:chorismate mutase / prephenate dehydratase
MSLEDLRKKVDAADNEIVRLIAERIRIAAAIGKEKQSAGKPVEDRGREKIVLDRVREMAQQAQVSPDDMQGIYEYIIKAAKNAEGVSVAFQGELGAYSEAATRQYFGPSVHVKPCAGLEDVFAAVEQGEVTFGIIPIENSLEGSISRAYDLLLESNLKVCGETELRVSHCLIVNPGVRLDMVKKVYSHPQALGQSQAFLRHLGAEMVPTYDTAGSVKLIKEKLITNGAAVASARAAEIYEMEVLASGIEDNPNNFTRFFVLAKQDATPTGNDKTSIVFSVKHRPGALYELLKELADHKINLTKIESRPTRQKPWEYNFYLDFEGHREDKLPKETLQKLESATLFMKVLGSYPKAK